MRDVAFGQYYPGTSLIHKLDPRSKILMLIAFMVLIFCAFNYYSHFPGQCTDGQAGNRHHHPRQGDRCPAQGGACPPEAEPLCEGIPPRCLRRGRGRSHGGYFEVRNGSLYKCRSTDLLKMWLTISFKFDTLNTRNNVRLRTCSVYPY